MSNFRNLVFVKNATNQFGSFSKGDRAQGRFPQELIDSYLKLGILAESPEPIALDAPIKNYASRSRRKKTT